MRSMCNKGVPPLIWITGLPGSGKSTLGAALVQHFRSDGTPCVFLDGDELRQILGRIDHDGDYTMQSRRELAQIYSRLATKLNLQGLVVVVATVSMFLEVYDSNRRANSNYVEVFLNVDRELLSSGPRKEMYEESLELNLLSEFPLNPDLMLHAKTEEDRYVWFTELLVFLGESLNED